MELPGDMATAPNSLHMLARSAPSPPCLASATRGHHLKTWRCCFHSVQVDLRWHSPLPALTGMSFLQKTRSLAAEGATHVRTRGQEKRRAVTGQALPSKSPGNAVCHLIKHPSCCPTSAPLFSSLCFLLQDEHMKKEEREEMRKIEAENKEGGMGRCGQIPLWGPPAP